MTPDEFIHTQRGARLYFLWEREKAPWKREEYQRMFNEELKKINGSIEEENNVSSCNYI